MKEPLSFYSKVARNYDNWVYTEGVKQFQEHEKEFLQTSIIKNSKVVDFGCGTGDHILQILDKNCEIVAIDFVEEMISIAMGKVGPEVKFISDHIKNISFENNYFDFGICYCTLPNQKDYSVFFKTISYFCKSLIVSVYNWDRVYELQAFYEQNNFKTYIDRGKRTMFIKEGLRYKFFTEKAMRRLFTSNGFKVNVRVYEFGKIYFGVK